MDIKSKAGYPANQLTNFAPHRFTFDQVECCSMEGLLQAFKFKEPAVQVEVCKLVGFLAKKRGKQRNWQRDGVWWQGQQYDRFGDDYQVLLDRAYESLARQSTSFRAALIATGHAVLSHSIGRNKQAETILTVNEFCSRLWKLRERIVGGEFQSA